MRARFVYIAGRGHSGSTVLDALLGNGEGIRGVGELVAGLGREKESCSCGVQIGECGFWSTVRDQFEQSGDSVWSEAVASTRFHAHIGRYLRTCIATDDDPDLVALAGTTERIVSAIAASAGEDVVVESSKEITRALFLSRFIPETKIIHLVRRPTRMAASTLNRLRSASGFIFLRRRYRSRWGEPFFIALSAAGWLVGNLLVEIIRLRGESAVLRVSFEDLCKDPGRELARIGEFIDCDLTSVRDKVEARDAMRIEHVIAGNRMRRRRSFVFEPERAAGRSLPWYYVAMVWLLTWPLVVTYRLLE